MCGEKVHTDFPGDGQLGSPPHVRGKARPACFHLRNLRITPACAGKSLSVALTFGLSGDHPRMCGEKWPMPDKFPACPGSPPHVRGKVKGANRLSTLFQDHPRMCGEKENRHTALAGIRGSPPHVRGKAISQMTEWLTLWDHPRMCGEKRNVQFSQHRTVGSPPHVRGKVRANRDTVPACGITPACAGKRWGALLSVRGVWDHPRMCGEKTKKIP